MSSNTPPLPVEDTDSAPFWDGMRRGSLLLQRCGECTQLQYYPRIVCKFCGGANLSLEEHPGTGTVYSFTISRRQSHPGFRYSPPYVVALIDLDKGPRMLANIETLSLPDLHIGQAVGIRFEIWYEEVAMPVFAPLSIVRSQDASSEAPT